MNKLLSVIVPVHNGEKYLHKALDSLLVFSHFGLEIIIIDEASTDLSLEIALSYGSRIKILSNQKWGGPSQARNLGIEASTGEYIGFLDQDDLWVGDFVSTGLQRLESEPSVDIVQCQAMEIDEDDNLTSEPQYYLILGSLLMKRSVFEMVGLFDESLKRTDDFDFFARIKEHDIPIERLDKIGYQYRKHDQNLSNNIDQTMNDFMSMLRNRIKRYNKD